MTQQGKPQDGDKVGYGVLYPIRFVGGDFESGTGFELIKSSAQLILDCTAASQDGKIRGELPANLRLGTHLRRFIHKNIRGMHKDIVRAAGLEGITELEPRIILDPDAFELTPSQLDRRIRVAVGIQSDPEYTGTVQQGTIQTELPGD
jgi:hypothetical protein